MAEHKDSKIEREYVIPLRKSWLRVPQYRRTGKAIKAIKEFLAKHMKVEDRDVKKIKIDVDLNNEIWFRGRANPPSKVKIKAVKENGVVKVSFFEVPRYVAFKKSKMEKIHKESEKPAEKPAEKKEEKTEEQKTEEKEKEKAVAEANLKEIKKEVKAEKHTTKSNEAQRPQRMALQK